MGEDILKHDLEPDATPAIEHQQDGVITVVLTADNHLGYTGFGQHPRKREERQQRLRHAFQQATDFAIVQGVDLFIQAGDLFDTTMPDERDRSFVAERLAQLKQAGIQAVALGGTHDTPASIQSASREAAPAPQMSYASLGALHYLSPALKSPTEQLEPLLLDIRGTTVGICGLGVLAGQVGDPLADVTVQLEIERAAIPVLVLHAPLEGQAIGSSLLDTRALVHKSSIRKQSFFRYILAGYHHNYSQTRVDQTDVIVAGATQYIDFSTPDQAPGFVFLGLAADGVRWCNHISVDALAMKRLTLDMAELWSEVAKTSPTDSILERLRPLCDDDSMVLLRLQGELARSAYHQLDLNQIRRYGEEHCAALAIDDSDLSLLVDEEDASADTEERLSLRDELASLADEWIASATDEDEQQALRVTKEEVLSAIDEIKSRG
ncbi:metallophosphoesterase family protein [Dictyobacter arantiisoli]|uniref:Nuclease n=1 Tax=Dictyobacter arantiisoli TaxID=2014874 RepID=A0A5A5T6P4_9CHLR|nr:metallophosphoesterase [Dictyobacter arantiisoli]GCF06693.1 nuclease [Dictyobacter arantiisoli]